MIIFGAKMAPQIDPGGPKGLSEASWAPSWPQDGAKSRLGSPWETKKTIWKDVWSHLGRQGGDRILRRGTRQALRQSPGEG